MLAAYCERICPPEARAQVLLGYALHDDGATLHELRRICGVPGTARPVDVARFRYDARGGVFAAVVAGGTGASASCSRNW